MKRLKSKRMPVWISTVRGAVLDLSGICYGPLAVTHALARFKQDFDDRLYAVTHVATGLALLNYVPFATAKVACVAFVESGIPWRKIGPKNCQQYGKRVAKVLKTLGMPA